MKWKTSNVTAVGTYRARVVLQYMRITGMHIGAYQNPQK